MTDKYTQPRWVLLKIKCRIQKQNNQFGYSFKITKMAPTSGFPGNAAIFSRSKVSMGWLQRHVKYLWRPKPNLYSIKSFKIGPKWPYLIIPHPWPNSFDFFIDFSIYFNIKYTHVNRTRHLLFIVDKFSCTFVKHIMATRLLYSLLYPRLTKKKNKTIAKNANNK